MSPSIPQFQPRLIPTIAVVILVPLFIGLGFWQLDRAEQKRDLAAIQHTRLALPPLQLTEGINDAQVEFRNLVADGVFVPEKTVFIENRKYMGRNGFHVITPLRVSGSQRYLLINRGWIEAQNNRLPPAVETPESLVEVTGRANIPLPPALNLGEVPSADANPRWPYLTLEHYARWSGLDIFPFVLLQAETDRTGFVRSWPLETPNEGMHTGYAIQWFAFALIVFSIWLRLALVRRTETGNRNDDDG